LDPVELKTEGDSLLQANNLYQNLPP